MKDYPLLQESKPFLEDFLAKAKKAKKIIWVQTMLFEPGPEMEALEALITRKVREHVDVRFTTDWVTEKYYENNLHAFPFLNKKWEKWQGINNQRTAILKRMQRAGIKVSIRNSPRFIGKVIPLIGRNHIKIFFADQYAWIGGVNLAAIAKNKDFMVRFTDKKIVSSLTRVFNQRVKNDYSSDIHKEYRLLMDAGRPGISVIFSEALALIKGAKKHIILISQFVPDEKILRVLIEKAKQGVRIEIITSDRSLSLFRKFPDNFFYLLLKHKIKHHTTISLYHYPRKVHAKLLLVDDAFALFGSHNFVWISVLFGTAEIAIRTTNEDVLRQCIHFAQRMLAKASPLGESTISH